MSYPDHLNFDINLQRGLTTSELAAVFERDTDFVHYIGHVDPEGFDCADGHLDVGQVGDVDIDMFVLNACSSYEQGQRLINNGAIAGVVTLNDVISSMATKIGRTIARLLNYGFPIGGATNLVQATMFSGGNYAVVGDSNASLAQTTEGVPEVQKVTLTDDGQFRLHIEAFASWNYDIGAVFSSHLDAFDCAHVIPGEFGPKKVDDSTLAEHLNRGRFPMIVAGEFYWSDNVSPRDLHQRLQKHDQ